MRPSSLTASLKGYWITSSCPLASEIVLHVRGQAEPDYRFAEASRRKSQ